MWGVYPERDNKELLVSRFSLSSGVVTHEELQNATGYRRLGPKAMRQSIRNYGSATTIANNRMTKPEYEACKIRLLIN